MRRLALFASFFFLIAPALVAQQNPAKVADAKADSQSSSSSADAPASRADIERYLNAMHTREMMHSMIEKMTAQMHTIMHDMLAKESNLPPDAEARLDKMMDDSIKDLPIDEMLDVMIPVYQKHLTKGDVDALIAFYSTSTGQKLIREMPAMTAESLQAASGIMQRAMVSAMDRAKQEVAEMQKEYENSRKSQSSTQN